MNSAAIQQSLFEVAMALARLDRRLVEITASIVLPPDLAQMQEDLISYDVNAHLAGIISCVRHDLLGDAIDLLKQAGEVTAADLRAEHRRLASAS